MPPSASTNSPRRARSAPVKAPFACPNSSLSSRASGNRRAVDGDEGLAAARRLRVDRAREHFLAGAALARQQHRRLEAGGALHHLEHFDHRLGGRHDRVFAAGALDLAAQQLIGAAQALALARLAQRQQQIGGREGLREVVVGAALHGLDGELRRAVGRHQDHGGLGQPPHQLGEQLEAVHAGHAQIAEHELGGRDLELAQGGFGVGCAGGFIALGREHQLEALAQGVVVVDDQDASGHGCETRIGRPARRREGFRTAPRAKSRCIEARRRASAGLPARGGDPRHKEAASLVLKSA